MYFECDNAIEPHDRKNVHVHVHLYNTDGCVLCVRVWEGEAVCEGRVCVCECVKGVSVVCRVLPWRVVRTPQPSS